MSGESPGCSQSWVASDSDNGPRLTIKSGTEESD